MSVASNSREDRLIGNKSKNITIINFGMGSPNAATIMYLLSASNPKAVLFLGKCGGLKKKNELGDFILPIAAIRGEGTSDDYLPSEIPALPSFALQKAISTTIRNHKRDYWTGTVYTTNRRVWEHDEVFKDYLRDSRCMGLGAHSSPTKCCLVLLAAADSPKIASRERPGLWYSGPISLSLIHI